MSKKVNVLLIGPNFNCKGGIATVLRNYLGYLDQNNINFGFLSVRGDGIKINKFFQSFYAFFKLILMLIMDKWDIVHMHPSENIGFYRYIPFIILSKIFRKRIILHIHGCKFDEFYNEKNMVNRKIILSVLEKADKIITLSKSWDDFLKSLGLENTAIIKNTVYVPGHNLYNEKSNGITFLGFIEKRKGIYDLVDALKDLQIDYILNVGGSGENDLLLNKITQNGLNKKVVMHGWIGTDQKNKLLADSRLFILPSYNEGLPMVVLEAMSYGIPIISTPVGGIPELVNPENGILISPGNVEELEKAIKELWEDKDRRCNMSKKNYNLINKEYSMTATFDRLNSIYRELMK